MLLVLAPEPPAGGVGLLGEGYGLMAVGVGGTDVGDGDGVKVGRGGKVNVGDGVAVNVGSGGLGVGGADVASLVAVAQGVGVAGGGVALAGAAAGEV